MRTLMHWTFSQILFVTFVFSSLLFGTPMAPVYGEIEKNSQWISAKSIDAMSRKSSGYNNLYIVNKNLSQNEETVPIIKELTIGEKDFIQNGYLVNKDTNAVWVKMDSEQVKLTGKIGAEVNIDFNSIKLKCKIGDFEENILKVKDDGSFEGSLKLTENESVNISFQLEYKENDGEIQFFWIIADGSIPTIKFTYPTEKDLSSSSRFITKLDTVNINFEVVENGSGINKVKYLINSDINGNEHEPEFIYQYTDYSTWSITDLKLKEGDNKIVISITDNVGYAVEREIIITYEPIKEQDRTPPKIEIKTPILQNNETIKTAEPTIAIAGKITDEGGLGVEKATLNGSSIDLNKDGAFECKFDLRPGSNEITIQAIDKSDNKDDIKLKVYYYNIHIELEISSKNALINKVKIELDTSPEIANKRAFVPIRLIAETFGAEVEWNSTIQEITITVKKLVLTLWVGITKIFMDNDGKYSEIKLDSPPYIKKGRSMVPLRAISDAFKAEIEWNSQEKKISIWYWKEET